MVDPSSWRSRVESGGDREFDLDRAPEHVETVAAVRETLAWVSLGASVVFAIYLVLNQARFFPTGREHPLIVACDAASWLVAVLVAVAARRGQGGVVRDERLTLALALSIVGNNLVTAVTLGAPLELLYNSLVATGVAAIVVRRVAWIAAVGAAALATGIGVVVLADNEVLGWAMLFGLPSLITSAAIHRGRRRALGAQLRLRAAERARQAELEAAMARLADELDERHRVEAEREALRERERALADQLRHVQKLDALGTLAGGIAHDMNNVLAAVVGLAEAGMESCPPGSGPREDFGAILSAAQRGASLTRDLLGFARRGKHRHEAVIVATLVEEVVAMLARTARRRVRFVTEFDETVGAVLGDPGQLSQVVMNLCLNAIDASAEGGLVTIRLSERVVVAGTHPELAPGRYLALEVVDQGVGMDAATLARVFEPFFSTKSSSAERSGLGLAMVYGTVRDHLGAVGFTSLPGRGAHATVLLPIPAELPARSTPTAPSACADDPRPLLVIDDEALIRRAVGRSLTGLGRTMVEADGGAAGLARFRADPHGFAAVILDLAMPGMTGGECFRALREIDPAVPIIVISGFPKGQDIEQLMAAGASVFLSKPFPRDALAEALATARRPPAPEVAAAAR
ncbi:MAG: response regulator [Kofleriaceae bacterium]|nr:response regulator [Kofleriaceae bacterium]MBP9206711.1 response regulator [Kofleriaceae bacterium]